MNLFDNLSNLLKWSDFDKFSKDKQDSNLGLDKVAPDDFNALPLASL